MKFKAKNLLVTGGAGFIGSNFIEFLLKKYKNVNIYNLDLLTYAGSLNNTESFKNHPKYKFIKGNICDKNLTEQIFLDYDIDGIINFAAETHVDNSIKNPEIFIETNIIGVYNLLNTAYKFWMISPHKIKLKYKHARFHQISTDEVYGSIINGSFNENSTHKPNSPYSASKASADMIVRSFNVTFGLNTIISRSSNNFGKNQNSEKFIPKIINAIKNRKEIIVYGDGLNIRDWMSVKMHCSAIDEIFINGGLGEIYNVAANNELTNLDLIEQIYRIMLNYDPSLSKKINFTDDRSGHDRRYSLDTKKIKNQLNWIYNFDFKIELSKYIKYLFK